MDFFLLHVQLYIQFFIISVAQYCACLSRIQILKNRKHLRGRVTRFLTIFLPKRFDLGPILTGENGFAKIFDRKVKKMCVPVVNDYADMHFFFFRYGRLCIFKLT